MGAGWEREREWGKGQLYLKGRWEEYIYIMILAVHLRFFFPFFVSRCGNAESSSRFDPTRIVLVYENRSTNIERISLEISALRKSYVFFYVYVYVYVTRLASPRHAAKTLTFCTGVMIVSKRSSFVRNSLGYFVSVRFVAFEPFLCCALLPDRIY